MAVVFLALCGTAFAAPSVPCHTAFSANTIYTFNESANISGSYCFAVAADNVTINCAGKSITGSNTSVGIQSTSFNTTVENCNISNFSIGIDYIGANNGMILNVTASTTDASSPAIYLSSSNYTVIANSTATAINGHAITVGSSSDYNTVCNNTLISSSGTGTLLSVDSSIGNRFYWNNFTDTGSSYATDSNPAGSNFYNATTPNGTNEGNIWYNVMNGSVQALGANHSAGFPPLYIGIAGTGLPYGVTSSLAKVNIGVVDYAPLTSRQALQCGALSAAGATYNLSANVSISGASCFNVTAANITLDCNGFGMAGNNSSSTSGVYSNQFNTTVRNCQISNFSTGIYFSGATNGTIQNTSINITQTITDKDVHGIYFYNGANYNRIIGSSAYASSGYGIFLRSGSSFNTITASSATTDTNNAIYIYSNSNNNTFNRSNATNAGHMSVCIETSSRNTFTNGQITGKQATYGALSINWGSANNTVSNSAINGNGGNYAATLMAGSNTGNRFINNTILNATTLIHLDSGAGINAFHWNNFTAATTYVDDANGSNYYNATISGRGEGNIWANVMDGSVEITGTDNSTGFPLLRIGTAGTGYPYNNSTSGGKLSGAVADYAPLTSAAPAAASCGTLSTPNNVTTLASNVSINGQTCFNVTAENVTLDCNGFDIRGNNASGTYGIYSNQLNTTIRNCNVSNFNDAIGSYNTAGTRILDSSASSSACNVLALYNATGAVVQNVNATKIGAACSVIAIAYGSNTIVENSTLIGVNGVWTDGSTVITGTRIVNNTFSCPASLQCINFGAKSSGSMVALNNFSGAGTYVIDNNGSNYYNYTVYGINQGNIYENVVNGSVSITGSSASSVPGFSVGTTGTGYPYNGTTSAGKFSCGFAGCGDYAPLTAAPLLNCSNLTAAGTIYRLYTPASINGATCFNVQAANVTLDCAGFSMLGNNSTRTYGVYSNQSNTTIKNCQISNFSEGIRFSGATGSLMQNNTITATFFGGYGIRITGGSHRNSMVQNSISTGNASGIYIDGGQNVSVDCLGTSMIGGNYNITYGIDSTQANTTVKNCIISNFSSAIYFDGATNGTIRNVTANTTLTQYGGDGSTGDGIVLSGADGNAITASRANSLAGYSIRLLSSSNNTIANSTANADYAAIFIDSGSGGNTISGTNATAASDAIDIRGAYNTIANSASNASSNDAFYLSGGPYNTIANSTATAGSSSIQFSSSSYNTIENTTLKSSSGTGTLLDIDSDSGGNTFYWNNFTATTGVYASDMNGSNIWNGSANGIPEGNIWANVMNGSVLAAGNTHSSGFPALYIGAFGLGYPYSNATAGDKLSGSVVDYAPLTSNNQLADTVTLALNGSSANISYVYSAAYALTINASSASGTQSIYQNGTPVGTTNYSAILGAGSYNITANSSGNANYTAASVAYFANVTQANSTIALNTSSWSIQAGTASNVTCTVNNNQTPTYLYRNGAQVGNSTAGGMISDTQALPAGTYNYTCNSTGSQNYTAAATKSSILTVTTPSPSPSPGQDSNGGGSAGSGSSSPSSAKDTSTTNVDVGLGRACAVAITREMSSSTSLSTLTTTLENTGGSGCSMTDYAFTDTIPSDFPALNAVTFNPQYTSRDGWAVTFNFPTFAAGESKVLTYSANQWIRTSLAKNCTTYTMTAKKAQAAQPTTNTTVQPQENSTWVPRKMPALPNEQPPAAPAAQVAPTDNSPGIMGIALVLGAIAVVAGLLLFLARKGRKKKGL